MTDPFAIHEDDISDRKLKDKPSRRWVEEITPSHIQEIEYLKPALKVKHARALMGIFFILLLLLAARGAQLQIIRHHYYRAAAETNRLRLTRIKAPRGGITDRNGVLLTREVPRFQLTINPLDLPRDKDDRGAILQKLAKSTEISLQTLDSLTKITKLPVSAVVVKTNLTIDQVYPLSIATQDIPGVAIEAISMREYARGPAFSHLLGYLGKIEQAQKEEYLEQGYSLDDFVGKTGIEAAFETHLKGRDGRQYIEVDAAGRAQNTLAVEEAISGQMLELTIDSELQTKTAEILNNEFERINIKRGAAIVMNPFNGEILALVSLPDFDNNLFTLRADNPEKLQEIFDNPDKPLFARAIAGTYPSGSTIKPAIAAAALQSGIITEHTTFLSTGGLRIKEWFFPDWRAGGHGLTNARHAIADSVNTFFYIIGGGYKNIEGLGIEQLARFLRDFGFGQTTGIEIGGEAPGLVPTPEWKMEHKGEQWYVGDTYHLAIGQGDISVTPLQIARMTAYFASEGKWVQPHIVKFKDLSTTPSVERENTRCCGPEIDPQNIETVRQGMRDAVRYGSARLLQSLPITSAGKTGTAEWSSKNNPHAWFTAWSPYDNPEIVVTVLAEEGGGESRTAAPAVKQIIEWWHQHNKQLTINN